MSATSAGCAAPNLFADRQILWHDPDDRPVPMPKVAELGIQWSGLRDALLLPADRLFTIDYGVESQNVNALDEVPDSTWFVDRRRVPGQAIPRQFSDEEMAQGPFGKDTGPVPPFVVTRGKTVGSTPGLIIIDAHKQRYLFKLDPKGWLGMNTSTEAVATRLAWAAGWIVPAEMIVDISLAQMTLDPKAKTKDEWDKDVPLSPERLKALLDKTPREADGTIRVCASRWIEGKNLGSWAYTGRRRDDANDRIPHQNRRDVRGFGVFASWVNDIDTMENNTMDFYVGKPGQGHILHYQQDVGGSFGQFAAVPSTVWMGEETYFMPGRIVASLFSFGALARKWDTAERLEERSLLLEHYPQLGYFDDADFDPRTWHPILDNPAFVRQTKRDHYWGAKRVVEFSESEVRDAIALGHYPPETAERLFQLLWSRRKRIAAAFFNDTAALDYFHFDGDQLCWEDLWLRAGLGTGANYFIVDGKHKRDLGAARCVDLPGGSQYRVVELGAWRGEKPATVRVHLIGTGKEARIVGIAR